MQTKLQKQEEESIIFGLRPVIEAIHNGKQVDKLFIQSSLQGSLYNELMILLKEKKIPYQFVPIEKLNRLTNKNHQGIVGYISPIMCYKLEDILPKILEKKNNPLLLILDRITDVRNFGAIVRTAECAGVDAIIIPTYNSAQINADAIKTSAGALYKVMVCKEENLKDVAEYLKNNHFTIVACTEKSTNYYYEIDFTSATAIIMGSEENGISNDLIQKSDYKVKIPLMGKISSLNVSVAAGIILYESVSQRMIS